MRETLQGTGESVDDEVLHALYEASAGIRSWQLALRLANAALGASTSRVITADARSRRIVAVERSDRSSDDERLRVDPHLELPWTRGVAEVVRDEHVGGDEPLVRDPGVTSIIAAKVREHRRQLTFVTFERSDMRAFSDAQFDRAARCIRHLATAMKVTQHCDDLKIDARVGHHLLHASPRPMLLLGRDREILACNPAGRALLRQANVVYSDAGILKCRLRANDHVLSKALERFLPPAGYPGERRNRAAVRLHDASGASILCSVASMVSEEISGHGDEHPIALLSFSSLDVPETQSDPEMLASLYGFSKAELRLVSALLRGENLLQIAGRNCVSLATVRTQLKSVFAKTNTHRQAEVIQLLLVALLL
ncbi:MAG TPA: hypothetical protein VGL43_01680 [Casimicrobiaceae bacterium]